MMKYDLKHFKRLLPSTAHTAGDDNFANADFVFQILGFYCYLADATFLSSLPTTIKKKCEEPIYLYDVVITDGDYKQKCLLRPDLAPMVQKKVLEVGSHIWVKHAIEQQYERDQNISSYVLLCNIEVKGQFSFPDPGSIPFVPTKNSREKEPCPLVTGRKCYLNTWFMSMPYITFSAEPQKFDKTTCQIKQPLVTLKELSDEWKSVPRPYPPLLVTVLLQGKLHHYGKNVANNVFPFQKYVEIGDDTGICSAVLWELSIISLFASIQPGTVLLLQNYTVIQKFPRYGEPVIRHTLNELEHFNLEIKLNKSSKVYIVDPTDIAGIGRNICLPSPQYWFATRDVLGELPHNTNVDVIGLVTYAGRFTRELCTARNGSRKGGFWVYRWIEMIDGTSPLPTILQIYINGQIDVHKKLMPGCLLACSQLRVTYFPLHLSLSCQKRQFYLTTTSESRLKLYSKEALAHEKEFARLNQLLTNRGADVDNLKLSVFRVGGSYHFPLCQRSLDAFQMAFPDERPFLLTPCLAWKNVVSKLSYKEYRRISVVGIITQVDFVQVKSNDGWIKQPYKRKHNCLFLDVCRQQDIKCQEIIGISSFCADVFPHQYQQEKEKLLQSWLFFAPFSADEHYDSFSEDEMAEIPVLCTGYYSVNITGVHPSFTIRAMMFPEPSDDPHPSLLKLLSGDYKELQNECSGNLSVKPTKYTKSEIKCIQNSAQEIGGMKFICVLDLYCHTVGKVEIILKHAFLCPEENITEESL